MKNSWNKKYPLQMKVQCAMGGRVAIHFSREDQPPVLNNYARSASKITSHGFVCRH